MQGISQVISEIFIMFKIFVFFACVCVVFGLPVDQYVQYSGDQLQAHHPAQIVAIVSEEFENTGDGNFRFGFVSGDGTQVHEEGILKIYDEKTAEEVVKGFYEYKTPEGKSIKVEYIADGNGFHPFSDDIPKSAGVASASEYTGYAEENQRSFYNGVSRYSATSDEKINAAPLV